MQFWDFPKITAFWENSEKNWLNLANIQQTTAKLAKFCLKKSANITAIFDENLRL